MYTYMLYVTNCTLLRKTDPHTNLAEGGGEGVNPLIPSFAYYMQTNKKEKVVQIAGKNMYVINGNSLAYLGVGWPLYEPMNV